MLRSVQETLSATGAFLYRHRYKLALGATAAVGAAAAAGYYYYYNDDDDDDDAAAAEEEEKEKEEEQQLQQQEGEGRAVGLRDGDGRSSAGVTALAARRRDRMDARAARKVQRRRQRERMRAEHGIALFSFLPAVQARIAEEVDMMELMQQLRALQADMQQQQKQQEQQEQLRKSKEGESEAGSPSSSSSAEREDAEVVDTDGRGAQGGDAAENERSLKREQGVLSIAAAKHRKIELWEELKVAAFTRALVSIYVANVATLLLWVQLHVVARVAGATVTTADTPGAAGKKAAAPVTESSLPPTASIQQYSELLRGTYDFFLGDGLNALLTHVTKVVSAEMDEWQVNTKLSVKFDEMASVLEHLRRCLEFGSVSLAAIELETRRSVEAAASTAAASAEPTKASSPSDHRTPSAGAANGGSDDDEREDSNNGMDIGDESQAGKRNSEDDNASFSAAPDGVPPYLKWLIRNAPPCMNAGAAAGADATDATTAMLQETFDWMRDPQFHECLQESLDTSFALFLDSLQGLACGGVSSSMTVSASTTPLPERPPRKQEQLLSPGVGISNGDDNNDSDKNTSSASEGKTMVVPMPTTPATTTPARSMGVTDSPVPHTHNKSPPLPLAKYIPMLRKASATPLQWASDMDASMLVNLLSRDEKSARAQRSPTEMGSSLSAATYCVAIMQSPATDDLAEAVMRGSREQMGTGETTTL